MRIFLSLNQNRVGVKSVLDETVLGKELLYGHLPFADGKCKNPAKRQVSSKPSMAASSQKELRARKPIVC